MRRFSHGNTFFLAGLFLLMSGCLHPGYYYGNPYGMPGYAPPQSLNPGQPSTLTIPESSGPAYAPGGTYDEDPDKDDFNEPDDDGDVPFPSDRGTPFYGDGDDLGPNTMLPESVEGFAARPVSRKLIEDMPMEYGFDRAGYKWLRGELRSDSRSGKWFVVYSLQKTDQFGGTLRLRVHPDQLNGLRDGDPVDVVGQPLTRTQNGRPEAIYDVKDIRLMATRVAG